jgi:hypothetical protein
MRGGWGGKEEAGWIVLTAGKVGACDRIEEECFGRSVGTLGFAT